MSILDRLRNKPKTREEVIAHNERRLKEIEFGGKQGFISPKDAAYKQAKAEVDYEYQKMRGQERREQNEHMFNLARVKRERELSEVKAGKSSGGFTGGLDYVKKNFFTGDLNKTLGYGGGMSALGFGSSKKGKSSGGFGGGGMMAALGYGSTAVHKTHKKKHKYGRYRGRTVRLD